MSKLAIHAIYAATEGEGVFIGTPLIFVRFQGCSLACRNCDSKETWKFNAPTLSLNEVMTEIKKLKLKRVSLTGGDPLDEVHRPGLLGLVKELKSAGYWINIEASGNKVDPVLFDIVDYISFDYKTPSTGVKTTIENIRILSVQFPQKFQVKSVVTDVEDFNYTLEAKKILNSEVPWCLTPAYSPGEKFPGTRFAKLLELNQNSEMPFRVIGQQHKWIFGPDAKNI